MRPNNNQRRSRGRSSGGGGGGGGGGNKNKPQRNQTYDSNGPEVRVRGNAHQIFEKYQVLAREAAAAGDRIAAESYYQHAEHYLRLINAAGGFQPQRAPGQWAEGEGPEDGDGRGDGRNEGRQEQREGRGHGGHNGYNGQDERRQQGRDQAGGASVDPEGDQPELPAAAFSHNEPG